MFLTVLGRCPGQGLALRSLWGTGREAPKAKLPIEPGFTLSLGERARGVLRDNSQAEPSAERRVRRLRPAGVSSSILACRETVAPRGDVFRTAATRSRAAALLLWGVLPLGAAAAWGTGRGGGARGAGSGRRRPHRQVLALQSCSNALSPSPVPFPSPHRKVPPSPTAQSPPPPLSFLQVVR